MIMSNVMKVTVVVATDALDIYHSLEMGAVVTTWENAVNSGTRATASEVRIVSFTMGCYAFEAASAQ
jgi:hypothetical protein